MPQFQFDRETALAIADDLTPLGINVAIIVVADSSSQPILVGSDGTAPALPVYQIELSRNANLDASKIADIAAALEPYEATVQFPSMNVVSTKPDPEPAPVITEPDSSGGGAVDEPTGDLVEPPQAQPADAADPSTTDITPAQ